MLRYEVRLASCCTDQLRPHSTKSLMKLQSISCYKHVHSGRATYPRSSTEYIRSHIEVKVIRRTELGGMEVDKRPWPQCPKLALLGKAETRGGGLLEAAASGRVQLELISIKYSLPTNCPGCCGKRCHRHLSTQYRSSVQRDLVFQ